LRSLDPYRPKDCPSNYADSYAYCMHLWLFGGKCIYPCINMDTEVGPLKII